MNVLNAASRYILETACKHFIHATHFYFIKNRDKLLILLLVIVLFLFLFFFRTNPFILLRSHLFILCIPNKSKIKFFFPQNVSDNCKNCPIHKLFRFYCPTRREKILLRNSVNRNIFLFTGHVPWICPKVYKIMACEWKGICCCPI